MIAIEPRLEAIARSADIIASGAAGHGLELLIGEASLCGCEPQALLVRAGQSRLRGDGGDGGLEDGPLVVLRAVIGLEGLLELGLQRLVRADQLDELIEAFNEEVGLGSLS